MRKSGGAVEKKDPKKEVEKSERKTVFNVLTDKHMLASFTSNVFSMALLIIGSIITFTFNKIQPQDLNRYLLLNLNWIVGIELSELDFPNWIVGIELSELDCPNLLSELECPNWSV